MTGPTLTLGLTNFAPATPALGWTHLVERAQAADAAGIDRVVVVDHVVLGERLDAYDGGTFPTGPDGDWLEPLTVLAVLAGATENVRLSTGILIAALRRPVVLAKAIATLDVLSGGRVDLGVGVGWQAAEYAAAGLDFHRRGRLLDETLEVCRSLWAGEPVPVEGADAVWCRPRPAQPTGVPIWVSGTINPRTIARIARFGDGWIPWGRHVADVEQGIAELRAALAAAGRDAAGLQVRGQLRVPVDGAGQPDLDAAMAPVARLVDAGVTDFQVGVRLPAATSAATDVLSRVVGAFRQVVGRAP